MQGYGALFRDGDYYVGEFYIDKYYGEGTLFSKEGWTYTGEFMKGLRQGKGKLTNKDGTVVEGEWKDDKWVDPSIEVPRESSRGSRSLLLL